MVERFTDEDVERFKDAFQLFDGDHDGVVTREEVVVIMRSLNASVTESQLAIMFSQLKREGPEKVDFPEFLAMMAESFDAAPGPEQEQEELIEAFKVFDKYDNGCITNRDLRQVMLNLGETMTPQEADKMIMEADSDGDGLVDYREFITRMCQQPSNTANRVN